METSDRKVTGSWASKKTTPVVALVIDLLIVTWPELRASSPHIRPLVGEVWSNFKNRLRILENGSHGTSETYSLLSLHVAFPYRPLPGSWGMLVEITVSGMIFQETAIKNGANDSQFFPSLRKEKESFETFSDWTGSIRHAEKQIETICICTFMRGIIFSTKVLMDLEMLVIDILLLRGFLVRIYWSKDGVSSFKEEDLQRI